MPSTDTPLELDFGNGRRSAVEQAVMHIASIIDLRRAKPGERLPSAAELAADVGVSRTAVLQALKILSSQGRVVVRAGRGGTWVTGSVDENLDARMARAWEHRRRILEMAYLREMLEAGVARLVAERGMSSDAMATARQLTGEMRRLHAPHAPGDTSSAIEQYRAADTEFHLLLARATGMAVIESVVTMCRREVAAAFDVMHVSAARVRGSDDEHDELLDAIDRRDGDAAAMIASAHVGATTKRLEAVLGGTSPTAGGRRRGTSRR